MLEDLSECESEESNSKDDIVVADLIEASDCESEQETAGGSRDKLWSVFQSGSEEEEFYGFS